MIEIENLSFKYGQKKIIDNLSLKIEDNDYIAIIGPNGSGKTTLAKCLIGLNEVEHNCIKIDGSCINCFKEYEKFGYVPQFITHQVELPITGMEIFKLITKDKQRIQEVIAKLNLNSFVNENMKNISGGQMQRIYLGKALLRDIKYLILDEPTTGLDRESRSLLYKTLEKLNEEGMTIIIISHHIHEFDTEITAKYDMEINEFTRVKNVTI